MPIDHCEPAFDGHLISRENLGLGHGIEWWIAYLGDYDLDIMQGVGHTEEEAIHNLIELLLGRDEDDN